MPHLVLLTPDDIVKHRRRVQQVLRWRAEPPRADKRDAAIAFALLAAALLAVGLSVALVDPTVARLLDLLRNPIGLLLAGATVGGLAGNQVYQARFAARWPVLDDVIDWAGLERAYRAARAFRPGLYARLFRWPLFGLPSWERLAAQPRSPRRPQAVDPAVRNAFLEELVQWHAHSPARAAMWLQGLVVTSIVAALQFGSLGGLLVDSRPGLYASAALLPGAALLAFALRAFFGLFGMRVEWPFWDEIIDWDRVQAQLAADAAMPVSAPAETGNPYQA